MSISIRLAQFGKKHAPSYKIVVANTKDKRNGRFLDILGYYNPSETPVKFECDQEKYSDWKNKGALITDAVEKLVAGTYEQKIHDPHKKLAKEQSDKDTSKKEGEKPVEAVKTTADEVVKTKTSEKENVVTEENKPEKVEEVEEKIKEKI